MTIETMKRDREYIIQNAGNIPLPMMAVLHERYVNGADEYLLGVEYEGKIYGLFVPELILEFCSCQTTHKKTNNQYLRFRPHLYGAAIIANDPRAICFGTTEEIYPLYKCNNKQGFNAGYSFEIAVYNKFHVDGWKQDNKPASEGGDIELNGRQVQMKFVREESLATVTSTNKILRRIDKLMREAA